MIYDNEFDETVIDVRAAVLTLFAHWHWIALSVITAMLVALSVSALQQEKYEASTLVTLSEGSQIALPDFIEMAISDSILSQLVVAAQDKDVFVTTRELKEQLTVKKLASSLQLQVEDSDRQRAVIIANLWAEAFTAYNNQTSSLHNNLTEAETALASAEQAQVSSNSGQESARLESQKVAAQQRWRAFLDEQTSIENALLGVTELHQQLVDGQMIDGTILQTTLSSLQLILVGVPPDMSGGNAQMMNYAELSSAEQLAQVTSVKTALESKLQAITQQLVALESEIETLTHNYQNALAEQQGLLREVEQANERVRMLSGAVNESHLLSQNMQIYSYASESVKVGRPFVTILLAMMLSLFASVSYIFLRAWWLEEESFITTQRVHSRALVEGNQFVAAD